MRLIRNPELKAEAELQYDHFLVAARADEVARLERTWSILCHDEFREAVEDTPFEALSKGIPPALLHMVDDVCHVLVEVVRPVDDGECVHGYWVTGPVAVLVEVPAGEASNGGSGTLSVSPGSRTPVAPSRAP